MVRQRALWCIAALLAVALAYANSFQNGFHFDDFHTVVENPYIRSLHFTPRFFTDATTFSVLPANQTYRPIVSLSLALDNTLARGYHPLWFHISTFAVFLVQLVAMFAFFCAVLRRTAQPALAFPAALFSTALYGLHPANAETVNYIIQRGDIYSACGLVAGLALYSCLPRLRRTQLYLLPVAVAMLSKPTAAVFPLLLAGYILYFDPPQPPRAIHLLRILAPSLLLCVCLLWFQVLRTPATFFPGTISPTSYRLTQPYVLMRYVGQFFLPLHLSIDTDLQPFQSITPLAVAGFLFVLGIIALCIVTARALSLRPISLGLFWFLVGSLPTSIYRLSEVENDHRMYLPFIGLVLATGWAACLVFQRLSAQAPHARVQRFALIGCCLLLLASAWGTHARNRVWRTEETLWRDDIQKDPHNGRGLMMYGLTQMQKGDYPNAIALFHRAELYTPSYPTLAINLGIAIGAAGNVTEADHYFRRALQLAPNDDQAHFFYARWLYQTGQLDAALVHLQQAVQLNPSRIPSRDLLVSALAASGRIPDASAIAAQTFTLDPTDSAARLTPGQLSAEARDYWITISLLRYRQQRFPAALTAAEAALRFDPQSAIAWNNAGAAYLGMQRWPEAIEAEAHALSLDPGLTLARNNLAWAQSQIAQSTRARNFHPARATPVRNFIASPSSH